MAERKRRADDDTVESVDAVDEDLDEATADAPADDDEKPARKSRARTETKKKADDKSTDKAKDGKKKSSKGKDKDKRPASKDVKEGRRGPIARIGRFIREVIAELRKVIWPNRKDLVTYAAVVIVFVAVMLTIVGFLDFGFARATLAVFGSGSK